VPLLPWAHGHEQGAPTNTATRRRSLVPQQSFTKHVLKNAEPPSSTRLLVSQEDAVEGPPGKDSMNSVLSFQETATTTSSNNNNNIQVQSHQRHQRRPLPGALWLEQTLQTPWIEVCGSSLVLLSSFLVAFTTLQLTPSIMTVFMEHVQNFILYTFALEFTVRWYATFHRTGIWRYLSQPLVLVDVVVVILPLVLPLISGMPPWLTSQSGLVNLRLLRILRLQRVLQDINTFSSFTSALGLRGLRTVAQPYQLQLARVVLSLFTLLSISTGLIYTAEHAVNPNMNNYFTALYFGLITLTTVGYGDITPVTFQGKLVVCGSILAGVAVIPAQAASLVEALLDSQTQGKEGDEKYQENESVSVVSTTSLVTLQANDNKTSQPNLLPSSAVDAVTPCPSCGAIFHWNSASYCWSCGSKLDTETK